MSDWIKWNGGECPVEMGVLVDVRHRDGDEFCGQEIGSSIYVNNWNHIGHHGDIVAYRLSETQQKSGALSEQIGGGHYKQFEIQPVEFINANNLDFLQGSVVKYISRHKLKGKQADVEKAIHFCKLILELQYEAASS